MHIAYVCADPGIPVFGAKGCSVHVQEGVRAFRARGARVTLLATRTGGPSPADLADVPVWRLRRLRGESVAERERAALAANQRLADILAAAGPFDLVYERYALWSHAGMDHARATGTPSVLEVNAPLLEEQARHRGLVDRAGALRVSRRAFAGADALAAVSREVAAYLEGFAEARGRVHVVSNGVNPDRFRPGVPPAVRIPRPSFTVGFVGSLKPWHGLPVLVEAFARLRERAPESRLLIVGDGPERERVEAGLRAAGAEAAVTWTGRVAPDEVPGYLAGMDAAVAPYPPMDSCYFSPLKVFEYMAAGVPVAASRIGQVAEIVRDGETGLLCPPGDAEALAGALDRLRREPALRARLAGQGRAYVLWNHSWDAVAGRILRLVGPNPLERHLQPSHA